MNAAPHGNVVHTSWLLEPLSPSGPELKAMIEATNPGPRYATVVSDLSTTRGYEFDAVSSRGDLTSDSPPLGPRLVGFFRLSLFWQLYCIVFLLSLSCVLSSLIVSRHFCFALHFLTPFRVAFTFTFTFASILTLWLYLYTVFRFIIVLYYSTLPL
jgi:hypothetical protein